ncbi:MAG: hypothetical protein HXY40_19205 [Chloroflexi bacterium]|nr:hypothetical protein [Chloroflexota bacterium]
MYPRRDLTATLATLPPEWAHDVRPEIRAAVQTSPRRLCVLDDDPTGTQTMHGITVYMDWTVDTLVEALSADAVTFYLLTNSRSLPPAPAEALNRAIGANLREASARTGVPFSVISRSDSTLRGHFPGELRALEAGLAQTFDAWLIVPFFLEGGRYTLDDVHYVAEGAELVPADLTPFAQDAAFGYHTAYLPGWVEEKTGGRIPAQQVARISLTDIRVGGPNAVAAKLLTLRAGAVGVVNAASYGDLEVFVAGLLRAEAAGGRYLYRTAASFVATRSAIFERPLVRGAALAAAEQTGGLIIVGSYVPKTGRQLAALAASGIECALEVDVKALLDPAQREQVIANVSAAAESALREGRDTVIYTSRLLVGAEDADRSLKIGQQVSDGLIAIVRGISTRPRFVLAKGGITSSDIATKAYGMRQAQVLGQLLPGVPVWQMGAESRFPGLTYVVFPGNVGDDDALVISRRILRRED